MMWKAVTYAQTGELLQCIQGLTKAHQAAKMSDYNSMRYLMSVVESTIECLSEHIESFTPVPEGIEVHPTASSLGTDAGVIVQADGKDVLCEAGKPISDAMRGGVCQCDNGCPHFSTCFNGIFPKYGRIAPAGMTIDKETSMDDIQRFLCNLVD